jgi:hypothetical protein
MATGTTKDFPETLAKIISIIFHPLFIPVYGMGIIFSATSQSGYIPFELKKLLFLIVLINNVLLPFSFMPFFRYRNIISSWAVENRRERIIPLIITTVLYSATSYIILRFPISVFLKSFIFASFFLSFAVTVLNFWWKISIHSVGAGALLSLVLLLSLKMYSPTVWYLISVAITAGFILSSRLKLNSHNPQQVWFGFLTGFLGLTLFMTFFL